MNEVFRRRLVGLAVLLVLLFVLSLLLPGAPSPDEAVPSETISLKAPLPAPQAGQASDASAVAETAAAPEPTADVAISDVERASTASTAPVTPSAVQAPKPAPAAPPPSSAALKLSPKVTTVPPKPAPSSTAAAKPVEKVDPTPVAPKPKLAESVAKLPKPAEKAADKASDKPVAAGWYVQIGSYSESGKASTIASLLQKIGYRADSSKIVNGQGKTLYRVRLGPYPSEAAAKASQDKVAKQGYPQTRLVQEGGR